MRWLSRGIFGFGEMQIGRADSAATDLDDDFPRARSRIGQLLHTQRFTRSPENGCSHPDRPPCSDAPRRDVSLTNRILQRSRRCGVADGLDGGDAAA